jgi:hypothetical protein
MSTALGAAGVNAIGYQQVNTPAYFTGYLSDVRVINGVSLYNSNFNPGLSPVQSNLSGNVTLNGNVIALNSNVTANSTVISSLLLNSNSAAIIDQTRSSDLITYGGAYYTNANTSPFTSSNVSMYFDGSSGYASASGTSAQVVFGTGNFTIEFWAYINAAVSSAAVFYDQRSTTTAVAPLIYMYTSNILYYAVGSTNQITGPTLSTNTWYHIAVCRSSGSTKMFVNGTQVGSTYSDSNTYVCLAGRPLLGSFGDTVANRFNGYMTDLRVTNGYARYVANFTAPTTPNPTQ